ncbi:hypothetical protein GCM10011491_30800 [Brucella endophytica]|uniref:Putative DnaT-like domain-containing protein n=1 Tax=Brucella endophytica TaxID=1963359 RepID=A0A916WHI5_9HYPH|nr:DnaT-like ssDNA-binding protein [Brucella endophytica]GGB00435.1 hypothetical protein GCM10011491_30800 [Brucella endophytica]
MAFSYPQVTISSTVYPAYVNVADADAFLNGSVNAAAWIALSGDDKGRAIVTAVRLIDAQDWKGAKTDPDNALAWPRTCQADQTTLPAALVNVTIQLAFAITQNPELAGGASSGQGGTKRLKAGSVEIEYFNTGILPSQSNASALWGILAPLAGCLASSGAGTSLVGAFASGTTRQSPFSDPDYSLTRGI